MTTDIDKEFVTHEIDVSLYSIQLPWRTEATYRARTRAGTPRSVGYAHSCGRDCFNAKGVFKELPNLSKNNLREVIDQLPCVLTTGMYQIGIRARFIRKGIDLKIPSETLNGAEFAVARRQVW